MKTLTSFGIRALLLCAVTATVLYASPSSADEKVETIISLLSRERYSEARQALEPLLKARPEMPRLRLIDGILRAREGKTSEAVGILERLRGDRPDMFEPHNNLAVLYAGQGRLDAARDALVAALELRPDAAAYANLGHVYVRLAERAYALGRELGSDADASPGSGDRSAIADFPGEFDPRSIPSPVPAARATDDGPPVPDRRGGDVSVAVPRPKPLVSAGPGAGCLRAGRFADRAAATEAAAWLQERGVQVLDIRHEQRRVVKNHRVYLPATRTAEAAAAILRELRGRGARDVAIIVKGPLANRISLGLYKSSNNARRRVAEIRKLGYPAESAANTKSFSAYAVRARTAAPLTTLEQGWNARFPDNPLRRRDCP